ncbi:tetratricopeptide repeat protein [Buchnera aphidicola]|nr:tetratricopeptide repeat protein [Buchnera aphidicola]
MYKKNINNNVIVKDFIRITKNLNKKNKDIINNKILFLKRRNSIYTTLVGINLSKQLFLKKKYIESTRILKKLLLVNSEENLLFLIKLNLLKLYIKQNKFSKAINIIASIQDSSWKKLFEKYNKIYFNKKRILA